MRLILRRNGLWNLSSVTLNIAKTLGMEGAVAQISKSTSIIRGDGFPYVESAGKILPKRTWSGKRRSHLLNVASYVCRRDLVATQSYYFVRVKVSASLKPIETKLGGA